MRTCIISEERGKLKVEYVEGDKLIAYELFTENDLANDRLKKFIALEQANWVMNGFNMAVLGSFIAGNVTNEVIENSQHQH